MLINTNFNPDPKPNASTVTRYCTVDLRNTGLVPLTVVSGTAGSQQQ